MKEVLTGIQVHKLLNYLKILRSSLVEKHG